MTSLPVSLTSTGSLPNSQSVKDAIASYRRAQYFVAGSTAAIGSDIEDYNNNVEEAAGPFFDESTFEENVGPTDSDSLGFADQLEWDDEDDSTEISQLEVPQFSRLNRQRQPPSKTTDPGTTPVHESTPLLRKVVSFSTVARPRRQYNTTQPNGTLSPKSSGVFPAPPTQLRRTSTSSSKSGRYSYGGRSTFGQTLFNSIAILLGIGMLSGPLAFAYSGWVAGTVLIVSYGFLACYTAKILARIIVADPRICSYADIGRKAFGSKSTPFISVMFCLELFAVSVVLVTLYADSLHTLIPQYSTTTYKLWGMILLVPTVFLPLSLLSYTSILGILSSLLVILVVFIDGFSKHDAPGSFWSPAETDIGVVGWNRLGLAFGLFMAGFSGHAVIPSLARDMVDPSQFDKMINWAFSVATLLYLLIGYAGYCMFGRYVSDEISMDLLRTPGYNPILNKAVLWMLVISPLSKFALTTQPLNVTVEVLFGINRPLTVPEDIVSKSNGLNFASQSSHYKRIFAVFQRVSLTLLSVLVSILVPDFSSMMALLGSFSAFIICVIGPISAKVVLAGRCSTFDAVILGLGVIMAVWGTIAAFQVA